MQNCQYPATVEKWCVFEVTMPGPAAGNPFTDSHSEGVFTVQHEQKTVAGFYDGNSIFKERFMSSFTGNYQFEIKSSFAGSAGRGDGTEMTCCGDLTVTAIFRWARPAMSGPISRRSCRNNTGHPETGLFQQAPLLCVPQAFRLQLPGPDHFPL
jgi:hypothetical protein